MNDQTMNSTINPQVRAGLDVMMREAAEERARCETDAAERRREELGRQASYTAGVQQTLAAFRSGRSSKK